MTPPAPMPFLRGGAAAPSRQPSTRERRCRGRTRGARGCRSRRPIPTAPTRPRRRRPGRPVVENMLDDLDALVDVRARRTSRSLPAPGARPVRGRSSRAAGSLHGRRPRLRRRAPAGTPTGCSPGLELAEFLLALAAEAHGALPIDGDVVLPILPDLRPRREGLHRTLKECSHADSHRCRHPAHQPRRHRRQPLRRPRPAHGPELRRPRRRLRLVDRPATGKPGEGPLYSDVVFHRIIPGFMIQGGDPLGQGVGGPGYTFNDEINPELTFTAPVQARDGQRRLRRNAITGQAEGTNGSQFFITVPGQGGRGPEWLQGKHTIFGEVADDASQGRRRRDRRGPDRRGRPPDRAGRPPVDRHRRRPRRPPPVTTDEFSRNRDNFCYRHPDRQSFVLCQRCLRTICPECQTQAPVGVDLPGVPARSAEGRVARAAQGGASVVTPARGHDARHPTARHLRDHRGHGVRLPAARSSRASGRSSRRPALLRARALPRADRAVRAVARADRAARARRLLPPRAEHAGAVDDRAQPRAAARALAVPRRSTCSVASAARSRSRCSRSALRWSGRPARSSACSARCS